MREYRFGNHFSDLTKSPRRFLDQNEALRFLREVASNFDTLIDLRTWASERRVALRPDRDLLHEAAACLVSGELIAWSLTSVTHGRSAPKAQKTETTTQRPMSNAPIAQSDPRDRVTPSALRKSSAEPAPSPTPVAEIDVAQQVATLLAAAKDGTPFCEQCERAKREKAQ